MSRGAPGIIPPTQGRGRKHRHAEGDTEQQGGPQEELSQPLRECGGWEDPTELCQIGEQWLSLSTPMPIEWRLQTTLGSGWGGSIQLRQSPQQARSPELPTSSTHKVWK